MSIFQTNIPLLNKFIKHFASCFSKKQLAMFTLCAYALFKDNGYEALMIVAALRGTYHMEELTGAKIIMSVHPRYQKMLLEPGVPRDPNRIEVPVPADVIKRLQTIPEFVRAYEPDGMKPEEFITYGPTQRTLFQFSVAGWSQLETFHNAEP